MLTVILLLGSTIAYGLEPNPRQTENSVRVYFGDPSAEPILREFPIDPSKMTVIEDLDFDLSISLEGATLELLLAGAMSAAPIVQVQYETSVSIMDDGPHLDLLQWKHFTSEWRHLRPDAAGRFVLPTFTPDQKSKFPTFSAEELHAAVSKAGGERWSRLLRPGSDLSDERVASGISAIRIRIIDESENTHSRQYVVEFPIPMGC